jgi:prephenate dehydrogenase
MQTIAIAGVGLIGGSFGLAARKAGFRGTILGVSSPRTIEKAITRGAIDRGATLPDAAGSADLLFLAQPISIILETLCKLDGLVKNGAIVTDAGSTKAAICAAAGSLPFVGGHPMAGKEISGVEAAEASLFSGRPWVFTSEPPPSLRALVASFGARILVMNAEDHDRMVAWSSHLPQLVSTALAGAVHRHAPDAVAVAGPGLRDMTRLAASPWDIWRDIIATNHDNVYAALDAYIDRLESLREGLDAEFERASHFNRELRKQQ